MGLESFKTEGPRIWTKEFKDDSERPVVHVSNKLDTSQVRIPGRVLVHRMYKYDEASIIKIEGADHVFICKDCGRVATSLSKTLKADKIDIGEGIWIDELISLTEDIEDVLEKEELWSDYEPNKSEEEPEPEQEQEQRQSSGIDSFKT